MSEEWCVVIPCADIMRAVDVAELLKDKFDWDAIWIKSVEIIGPPLKKV